MSKLTPTPAMLVAQYEQEQANRREVMRRWDRWVRVTCTSVSRIVGLLTTLRMAEWFEQRCVSREAVEYAPALAEIVAQQRIRLAAEPTDEQLRECQRAYLRAVRPWILAMVADDVVLSVADRLAGEAPAAAVKPGPGEGRKREQSLAMKLREIAVALDTARRELESVEASDCSDRRAGELVAIAGNRIGFEANALRIAAHLLEVPHA